MLIVLVTVPFLGLAGPGVDLYINPSRFPAVFAAG